ncbi:unnamed protein product, partial [Brenthis ino]
MRNLVISRHKPYRVLVERHANESKALLVVLVAALRVHPRRRMTGESTDGVTRWMNYFLKVDLFKISSDLLQLVCGHRAESIEMRRETITGQVRDPLVKTSLNKIPPSTMHLFDSEAFSLALEKSGGVRKVF